jgi:hypothetical protein
LTIGPAQYWVSGPETLFRPCFASPQMPTKPQSMPSRLPVSSFHNRPLTPATCPHSPILPPWRASISP